MKRAQAALAAALVLAVACASGDTELPQVAAHAEVACDMPPAAPALILEPGGDPSRCVVLPSGARWPSLAVEVSPDGRAIGIQDVVDLCLVVDGSGREIPTHVLSPGERACVLEELASWRFAAVRTCRPVYGTVPLGGSPC